MEEAAQLAHRVAIMDAGRIIADGTPQALVASLGARDIALVDFDRAPDLPSFQALAGVAEARAVPADEGTFRLRFAAASVASVLPALLAEGARQGLALVAVSTHQATLEDVFIHYTGRQLRDD
jgi:ABC-2 type transport system ATP-binding protein